MDALHGRILKQLVDQMTFRATRGAARPAVMARLALRLSLHPACGPHQDRPSAGMPKPAWARRLTIHTWANNRLGTQHNQATT